MSDPWVSDPDTWCSTLDDLARWCLDEVPEEPRVEAPLYLRFLPRVVNLTVEHSGSGYGFRAGDLYFSAWQTAFKKAHLRGTLSSGNVPNGVPGAPDVTVDVAIYRNFHLPDPSHDWYRLSLSGADVAVAYNEIYPLELTRFPADTSKPWQGLNANLGPPIDIDDTHYDSTWWINFIPSYAFGF